LFHQLTGKELIVHSYGKPLAVTFNYARRVLDAWRDSEHLGTGDQSAEARADEVPPLANIFMVGDNPKADIRGANAAGKPWRSVLVETGVYQPSNGQVNDPTDPAHFVCANVSSAVDTILREIEK
jgi:ribonucleotide monophosphatase NagD (HAD superfamily)